MDENQLEFMMQMAALGPEDERLKKRQAMVDALRQQGMTSPKGQMVGAHYVAPSIAQTLAQVGSAYAAKQGQSEVDQGAQKYNQTVRDEIEKMRRRKMMGMGGGMGMPSSYAPPSDPWNDGTA